MSVEAMAWALAQETVADPTARHVLLCLANYANQDGQAAFPSVERLRHNTGLSERTIRYKLDLLESLGVIKKGKTEIAAAYIGRADRLPVCYDICIPPANKLRVQLLHLVSRRGAARQISGCK
jgi:DNA-binding Lrp family transcriptional regulator